MKPYQYNLEEPLGYLIGRAHRVLVNRLNRNFAEAGYDVTAEQWGMLMHLWEQDGQGQQQLAACACKDKTSITRLIDGLEKRHLVLRVADQNDRRNNLIYLTGKGKALQKALIVVAKKTLAESQQGLKPEHLTICKNTLRKVYQNLSEA
jgi:DNA-binding MarR family transcriptional regulator